MGAMGTYRLHKCVLRWVLGRLLFFLFVIVSRDCVSGKLSFVFGLTPIFVSLLFFLVCCIFLQEYATLIANELAMHLLGAKAAVAIGTLS